MKYVIRKVPCRNVDNITAQIPDAVICEDANYTGCLNSFCMAIDAVGEDAVYIQDDVLLCKDFKEKAEKYINQYPDKVIVFANFTHDKSCSHAVTEGFYKAKEACWLLCTYIPHKIAEAYKDWYRSGKYTEIKSYKRILKMEGDDIMFCRFLEVYGADEIFLAVPNLAQHKKNKSVVNPNRPYRTNPNFRYE